MSAKKPAFIVTEDGLTVRDREFVFEQKYRPSQPDEIILPTSTMNRINGFLEKGRIPNFLFYSPSAGTGKTTLARIVASMVGCDKPLFINASLKTDVGTIRTDVINYASGRVLGNSGQKVVILDEVERLSDNAQEALKGITEQFSKTCTFILTTNSVGRINKPLQSRCRRVDFIWTDEQAKEMKVKMVKRLEKILRHEGIEYELPVIMKLVVKNFPDNRTTLGQLHDYAVEYGKIDVGVLSAMNNGSMANLIDAMKRKSFKDIDQWVVDNINNIGADFYGKLTRILIKGDGNNKSYVQPNSVMEVIGYLGEEQKYMQSGDKWLHTVQALVGLVNRPNVRFL